MAYGDPDHMDELLEWEQTEGREEPTSWDLMLKNPRTGHHEQCVCHICDPYPDDEEVTEEEAQADAERQAQADAEGYWIDARNDYYDNLYERLGDI